MASWIVMAPKQQQMAKSTVPHPTLMPTATIKAITPAV
jgi:hypothetical protein